jgi:hypothetical protein
MTDDDVGTLIFAVFIGILAVPIFAAGVVVAATYGAFLLLRAGYRALQGPPVQRELARVEADRAAAINQIIAIRQAATRRMVEVADHDVIEGRADEIEE